MIKYFTILLSILKFSIVSAENNVLFFVESALQNNPKINAERENLKAVKQNENISRSEFFPSLTISGSQSSTETSNIIDQSGTSSGDTKRNTETKKISIDQKIFQGFQGYNNFKKSQLEFEKAKNEFKHVEQDTILNSVSSYFDLVFKNKSKDFNLANVDLFERQVESDRSRLQKGEISLTDLAQSESSLAGANANLIKAKTELLASKTNFQRVTREKVPKIKNLEEKINLNLPDSLNSSLELSNINNLGFLIAKLNYEISMKELNIERSRLSPTASIEVSKTESKDFSSTIDKTDDEKVKATITWPIIKGGENFSSIKKSSYEKQRAKLILQDTKNKIKSETFNSWSKFQSSKSVLEATRAQLKAAEIANEGITSEYNSGNTRTTLELIQSRSLLLDARIAFAKAERDFIISQFELAKQIGTLSLKLLK